MNFNYLSHWHNLAVITLTAERNRCLAGVLISGEDRAGRSAAGCPRSIASTPSSVQQKSHERLL